MLTVAAALDAILREAPLLPSVPLDLDLAAGRTLRDTIASDVDIPPFDKALMDGYAIRSVDFQNGTRQLHIVEEILAGSVPQNLIGPHQASRIMTGAIIPPGADAVVPVEQTNSPDSGSDAPSRVNITAKTVVSGQNLIRRGTVALRGDIIVPASKKLRAQEIGALAEAGSSRPHVAPQPRVAILATGDELVPAGKPLSPGQIRNSNEPMLAAQILAMGGLSVPLGIAPDQPEPLLNLIRQGLKNDLLILSGGVSAGKRDLVPSQLAAAGVRQIFHKIQMRPGKPLWFGVYDQPDSQGSTRRCLVFGLPGNPVSSMVCADLFIRPTLRRMLGIEPAIIQPVSATLVHDFLMTGDRPTYQPARLSARGCELQVEIVDWAGSSDLRSTVSANGTVFLPPGEKQYHTGDLLAVHLWEETDSLFG